MDDARRRALLERVTPPDFDTDVDLDAHVGLLPAGAGCKGLFHGDVVRKAAAAGSERALFERAGLEPRRYRAFKDHPYEELLRLLVAGAEVLWPDQPTAEGLRRLGQGAYDALTSTHFGRVLFGVLGRDFSRIAAAGVKGWTASLNFGSVAYERLGERRGAYFFDGVPGFLETFQVGVVEGGLKAAGTHGRVRAALDGLDVGVIEFDWD